MDAQIIDVCAMMITDPQPIARDKALRVREAVLALLRAWEDAHALPRSIPTRLEQRPRTRGGHVKQS